jgi:hypothetical protein
MSRRDRATGQRYLAGAYGFACGIGFMSHAVNSARIDRIDITGVGGRRP